MTSVYTSSDGMHTEGIGALAQYQLFCYGLCKLTGKDYRFRPFSNLQHYQYHDVTQQEFCDDVNSLFAFDSKLPDKDTLEVEPNTLMREGQANVNLLRPFLSKLSLQLDDSKVYFDAKHVNVAIHVRVYTKTDCDLASSREYFNKDSGMSLDYYKNIISTIENKYTNKPVVFHIYSQGSEEDFLVFKSFAKNVRLHIEEYPIISLYHMANSDILLMANSSLSYVAHLYGKAYTLASQGFYHKLYEDRTFRVGPNGLFDPSLLP